MRNTTSEPTKEEGKEMKYLNKNKVFSAGRLGVKEEDKGSISVENTVWVDAGDCVSSEALGILQFCLIRTWKTKLDPLSTAKEVEA